MKIEINNRTKSRIALPALESAAAAFARAHKLKGDKELSVALVGDAEIKKLNRIYRGLNSPTDILSFAGEGGYLGELVIDYEQIKRQAKRFGNSAKQELIFIFVHGLLHLLGYDDKTEPERREMIERGERFIKKNL